MMAVFLIGASLTALAALWGLYGDADFSTLISHMVFHGKRNKYRGEF